MSPPDSPIPTVASDGLRSEQESAPIPLSAAQTLAAALYLWCTRGQMSIRLRDQFSRHTSWAVAESRSIVVEPDLDALGSSY